VRNTSVHAAALRHRLDGGQTSKRVINLWAENATTHVHVLPTKWCAEWRCIGQRPVPLSVSADGVAYGRKECRRLTHGEVAI